MQVSLTPNAEHILRDALAQHPGQSAENLVEQALAQQFGGVPAQSSGAFLERLKNIPGVRLPEHWPPRFTHFEPVTVEGHEPVSEQLIRERR